MFVSQLLRFLLTVATLGFLAHSIGEALPRRWFHADAFPWRAGRWEQGGRVYLKLSVRAWKDRLPDMSRFVHGMYRKNIRAHREADCMERLVQETCVAECVHWVLLGLSPVFIFTMAQPYAAIAATLYALSHVPFIVIQRFNRPRLLAAAKRSHMPLQSCAAQAQCAAVQPAKEAELV